MSLLTGPAPRRGEGRWVMSLGGGTVWGPPSLLFQVSPLWTSPTSQGFRCRGPAPVDPGWFEGGVRSRHLWKNTYLITDIERLETDSVVGRLVEKKRLNNLDYIHAPDGNSARKMGARKKRHGGISLSGNWSDFFVFRFAYIPFVTHRDEYRVTRESAVLTFIKIRCFT